MQLVYVIDRMAGFLLNWCHEIADPDPERTLRFALIMVISTIRDFLVYSETTLYKQFVGIDLAESAASMNESFLRIVNTHGRIGVRSGRSNS